jgi:hypothetical protein
LLLSLISALVIAGCGAGRKIASFETGALTTCYVFRSIKIPGKSGIGEIGGGLK